MIPHMCLGFPLRFRFLGLTRPCRVPLVQLGRTAGDLPQRRPRRRQTIALDVLGDHAAGADNGTVRGSSLMWPLER